MIHFKPASRTVRKIAVVIAVSMGMLSVAQAQMVVPSAGVIPDVAGATDKPDASRTYKLAFDMVSMPSSSSAVSPALTSIARLLNTYRKYGVPADHIQATAVFHGNTIALVTKDETYRNRTGGKANPNVAILRELTAAGVKLVVCGVSARDQGYEASDLLPSVTLNLSATVTFIELQSQGYVKVER